MRWCLLAGALVLSTGCSLLLDFGDAVTDGGPEEGDAREGPDAGPDPFEPNEAKTSPALITPGSYNLTISPLGDQDWFQFDIVDTVPHEVIVDVLFQNSYVDIDVELHDSISASAIDGSSTFFDNERIERLGPQALPPGTYFIRVFVFNNVKTNFYQLGLTVN